MSNIKTIEHKVQIPDIMGGGQGTVAVTKLDATVMMSDETRYTHEQMVGNVQIVLSAHFQGVGHDAHTMFKMTDMDDPGFMVYVIVGGKYIHENGEYFHHVLYDDYMGAADDVEAFQEFANFVAQYEG